MKNYFIINLDSKRIILLAGGLLFLLGSSLYFGMMIGQKKSTTEQSNALTDPYKENLQNSPLEPKIATPVKADAVPAKLESSKTIAAEKVEPGLEIQSDPLVQGPPKATHDKKLSKNNNKAGSKESTKTTTANKNGNTKEQIVAGKIKHGKTDPKSRYVIQVAAYEKESDATRLISKLKESGLKARTEHTGHFYLVVVGKARNKEKLEKALAKLKELEYDAYIRKSSADSKAS